jgi:hypothetical protein
MSYSTKPIDLRTAKHRRQGDGVLDRLVLQKLLLCILNSVGKLLLRANQTVLCGVISAGTRSLWAQ